MCASVLSEAVPCAVKERCFVFCFSFFCFGWEKGDLCALVLVFINGCNLKSQVLNKNFLY